MKELFKFEKADHMPADLLEEILVKIKDGLGPVTKSRELLFKSKFILIELFTNAIKHAHSNNTALVLEVTDKYIRFTKTDDGKPLMLSEGTSPLFKNAAIVTADIMHTLYAVKRGDNVYFYCHENITPSFNVEHDFPEHFGLLIITKAADEFYYVYNQQNNINTFTATIGI